MRHLTAALLAAAFALGSVSASACEWMKTASTSTKVASAEQSQPASTKVEVPESEPQS